MSDRISGVAAVGGIMVMDDCLPEQPVSILALHGTKDGQVPYGGGPTSRPPVPAPSQTVLMETRAQRNGCAPVASRETAGDPHLGQELIQLSVYVLVFPEPASTGPARMAPVVAPVLPTGRLRTPETPGPVR